MAPSTPASDSSPPRRRPRRRIVWTFDDAPNSDDPCLSDERRTTRLIESLHPAGVAEVLFFCVTNKRDPAGLDRLHQDAEAGHVLANHTHDHCSLEIVDVDAFLENVRQADAILSRLPNFRPYFRFPFLSQGNTSEKRSQVRSGLEDLGYVDAYITVPTLDWYLQELFFRQSEQQVVDLRIIRNVYVRMVVQGAGFSDDLAIQLLGRSPGHVLLLHENDLASLFIADVMAGLRTEGWEIVSALQAYSVTLSKMVPQGLAMGHGRLAALAEDRRYAGPVTGPWETKAHIDGEFERLAV